MIKAGEEIFRRVCEAGGAVKWLRLVEHRRQSDSNEEGRTHIPEKEFLLVHSQRIDTNPAGVGLKGKLDPLIEKWMGKGLIIDSVEDETMVRVRFRHDRWKNYTRPPDHAYHPLGESWLVAQPRAVLRIN